MCCENTQKAKAHEFMGIAAQKCGCGCIGNHLSKTGLEKYREHLAVELSFVEKQIRVLEKH